MPSEDQRTVNSSHYPQDNMRTVQWNIGFMFEMCFLSYMRHIGLSLLQMLLVTCEQLCMLHNSKYDCHILNITLLAIQGSAVRNKNK